MALSASAETVASLVTENIKLQNEVARLRASLAVAAVHSATPPPPLAAQLTGSVATNGNDAADAAQCRAYPPQASHADSVTAPSRLTHGLSKSQIERYSRHLLVPSVGVDAQRRVCSGSVLIIGCGGLGAPAALYLTAAGVGRLGLVDHDSVELSNLHRQVIHTEGRVGVHKALSAQASCQALNSLIKIEVHLEGLCPSNALALVQQYDIVIDASDNPPTRYLISDACVIAGKPLVSAAAVGTDGQLTVYCHGDDGPCYRCLFPAPPAPENCSRCGDAGVLGPVPGTMGTLQALEALKVLGGIGQPLSRRLLIFDGLEGRFTTVKLRGRTATCAACGAVPVITAANLADYDYESFTGQPPTDGPPKPLTLLHDHERLSPAQLQVFSSDPPGAQHLQERIKAAEAAAAAAEPAPVPAETASASGSAPSPSSTTAALAPPLVLLDVRPGTQFNVMSLAGAHHIAFDDFSSSLERVRRLCCIATLPTSTTPSLQCVDSPAEASYAASNSHATAVAATFDAPPTGCPHVVVLCRRGNNSQIIVKELRRLGVTWATDLRGGYTAWASEVDHSMPVL